MTSLWKGLFVLWETSLPWTAGWDPGAGMETLHTPLLLLLHPDLGGPCAMGLFLRPA